MEELVAIDPSNVEDLRSFKNDLDRQLMAKLNRERQQSILTRRAFASERKKNAAIKKMKKKFAKNLHSEVGSRTLPTASQFQRPQRPASAGPVWQRLSAAVSERDSETEPGRR